MIPVADAVTGLIIKAQKVSSNFNDLIQKTTCLLADCESVNKKFFDSCGVQDDQLLKNLVKYCNDDERIQQLLENAELKQTVEDYKEGVKIIMEKFRKHCQQNALGERFNLRRRYVGQLQEMVNNLEKRIEEMTLIMLCSISVDEHNSNENQRIIRQLAKDNEEMRRKLQIYTSTNAESEDYFKQGLPAQADCGTQIELGDMVESDSSSNESFGSFVTCYSSANESQSTDNSTKSDVD
ncbi:hypothetical protein AWZ03_006167 [Drosophila navojoa]|uniref:Uncharacterized protein n=1 Tax=Drosophila navojoa TaxID=7232 RepID=A0A484BFC8_DRONA|nr:FGFR1 oncogene partner 2 homolog [Drosophila navojoa]TDG47439.1 hypothetical protein AWZ03_006167 [Drosophila navojoa]